MANEKDIAFNYPPDGCYARAHMMTTRIRETYGVEPSKVWAFGDLSVDTNGPYGSVRWGYHVAPVLPVLQPDGTVVNMVIDPSIARRPISVNEWKAIMHAPTADTQITLLGQPPTNASTGKPYPGTGYWPGQDPYNGDLDAYSAEVMRRYLEAGEKGTDDVVPPSPRR
ncbi:MAG: hypothetical protein K1X39_09360 [Thermoflexales bacterium]|nr:hypothetical protein [Thermoflexales bacterium]